jgi:hypothetical protein
MTSIKLNYMYIFCTHDPVFNKQNQSMNSTRQIVRIRINLYLFIICIKQNRSKLEQIATSYVILILHLSHNIVTSPRVV